MRYIDIHSHLQFPEYDNDRDDVIARMETLDVGTIVVGTDLYSSRAAVALAEKHKNIFACIGFHPADDAVNRGESFSDPEIRAGFNELIKNPKVVAVGECGLDYGRDNDRPEDARLLQRADFIAQIDLAVENDKPVMLHCRNSHDDVLNILAEKKLVYGDRLRGNSHFFSGDMALAQRYFDLGFTISFTGVITFARNYDDAVRNAPLGMIMSETDSPFVSPVPYRGTRNDPSRVVEVVKKIAEICGEPIETIEKAMIDNAKRVFGV